MKRIVTAEQMKLLDNHTIIHHKIDALVLMERAALAVIKYIKDCNLSKILVVCGSGNNGGDGIAVARMLHLMGYQVDVFFAGNPDHKSEGCSRQMEAASSYHIRWVNNPDYSEYTTIIDALFGVGLSRTITGYYAEIIERINAVPADVVAVDIPSGVNADDGKVMGCAVRADLTITFAFAKVGQLIHPGKGFCGRLVIEDIGIYEDKQEFDYHYYAMENVDLKKIPHRPENGNKGTFGKVLLIAGSPQMPGASILCGRAIMRCGSGMLKMVVPSDNREIIATTIPEAMLATYDSVKTAVQHIGDGMSWADVVVLGPGLSTDSLAEEIVECVLHNCTLPLVIDADGLNIISKHLEWLERRSCPCIITPHMGEMARLRKVDVQAVQAERFDLVRDFASRYGVQCVLKDSVTCTALPDKTIYINRTGNCGMATAGSGDVLTGIIGGLLSLGMKWEEAGALGVWLHGASGDRCKEKNGSAHLMAGDLINALAEFRIGEEGSNIDEGI